MTNEEIICMAREARLAAPFHPFNPWSASQEALERFARLVAAAEREACARIIEAQDVDPAFKLRMAHGIRARDNEIRSCRRDPRKEDQ